MVAELLLDPSTAKTPPGSNYFTEYVFVTLVAQPVRRLRPVPERLHLAHPEKPPALLYLRPGHSAHPVKFPALRTDSVLLLKWTVPYDLFERLSWSTQLLSSPVW